MRRRRPPGRLYPRASGNDKINPLLLMNVYMFTSNAKHDTLQCLYLVVMEQVDAGNCER